MKDLVEKCNESVESVNDILQGLQTEAKHAVQHGQ